MPAPPFDVGGDFLFPSLKVPRDHPRHAEFLDAVAADATLAPLISEGDRGVFLTLTTGSGSRVQPEMLAGSLVGSAATEVLIRGESTSDAGPLLVHLDQVVRKARALTTGDPVDITVVTAFEGVNLTAGSEVETPWGVLRSPTEAVAGLRLFGPRGRAPTAVLVSRVEARGRLGEPPDTFVEDPVATETMKGLAAVPERLSLAVMIGVDREAALAPGYLWQTTVEPIQSGWGLSGPPPTAGVFAPQSGPPLSDSEQGGLEAAARRVEERYDASIAVAVTRTISAIRERASAEDAVIDAVIAWENLFGPRGATTEVVFRVTGAIAALLEGDLERRITLRKDLGRVYDVRSKVVHGEALGSKDHLPERKDLAITIAVKCLRALFNGPPELLAKQDRGTRLILGGVRERA